MQVDWWTLVLQTINFLVLVWLLERFLFRPVRGVLRKRQETVNKTLADAEASRDDARRVTQSLEAARKAIESERAEMLTKAHDEIEAQRDKVLAEAHREADRVIASARELLDNERVDALDALRDETVGLAGEMARNILLQMHASVSQQEWLRQAETALKALTQDDRNQITDELKTDGARLHILTATPLTAEEQAEWSDRLSDLLKVHARIEFEADPALIGGAELHFPHAVVGLNWASQLKQAQEVLLNDVKPG